MSFYLFTSDDADGIVVKVDCKLPTVAHGNQPDCGRQPCVQTCMPTTTNQQNGFSCRGTSGAKTLHAVRAGRLQNLEAVCGTWTGVVAAAVHVALNTEGSGIHGHDRLTLPDIVTLTRTLHRKLEAKGMLMPSQHKDPPAGRLPPRDLLCKQPGVMPSMLLDT